MSKDVPWEYSENPSLRLWRWLTDHFDATVRSDGKNFVYTVTDLTRGKRIPLVNDFAKNFADSEAKVLEFVGKSYHPGAGYRPYAGKLATTFTIATGEAIDFAPFEGSRVTLVVNDKQGPASITGSLTVHYHELQMRTDSSDILTIPPLLVVSIQSEAVGRTVTTPSGAKGRTVKGSKTQGCTGQAGFIANTVEHPAHAKWCPVHRV